MEKSKGRVKAGNSKILTRPPVISEEATNGKQPLLETNAIIEEYKTVRAEIVQRIGNQSSMVNYSLALIAAIIAISQINPDLLKHINLGPVYLLASLLFSAFAMMLIEQDLNIAYLGKYIDSKLRTRMEEIINSGTNAQTSIWDWDRWKNRTQYRKLPDLLFVYLISASRYAITVVPSAIALLLYNHQRSNIVVQSWENPVFAFCIFAFIWTITTAVFSGIRYVAVEKKRNKTILP